MPKCLYAWASDTGIINSSGNTQQTVESTASSLEIQSFNAQIMPYLGTNLSAKQVRNFLDTVIVINSQAQDNDDKIIRVNYYDYTATKNNKGATLKHKTSVGQLTSIKKDNISDKSTYQIIITGSNCTSYGGKNGYKDSGYLGCISIKTLTQ